MFVRILECLGYVVMELLNDSVSILLLSGICVSELIRIIYYQPIFNKKI